MLGKKYCGENLVRDFRGCKTNRVREINVKSDVTCENLKGLHMSSHLKHWGSLKLYVAKTITCQLKMPWKLL